MKKIRLILQLWATTAATFSIGTLLYGLVDNSLPPWAALPAFIVSLAGSFPAFVVLFFVISFIHKQSVSVIQKCIRFFIAGFILCNMYGAGASLLWGKEEFPAGSLVTVALSLCYLVAILISHSALLKYFSSSKPFINQYKPLKMQSFIPQEKNPESFGNSSNRILWKAVITGVLILVMLIPAAFLSNLVKERKARQAEVVAEVSDKWAQSQLLSGPYLYLPYSIIASDQNKKETELVKHLILLPETLKVDGDITHEIRKRSIYKVLLYQADIQNKGQFELAIPKEIDLKNILWKDAKICYNLTDFKGIEERMVVDLNGQKIELSPGLPSRELGNAGLSASVSLSAETLDTPLVFSLNMKIKGSETLQFLPLAGNSRFELRSDWNSPSFDGSDLPSFREVKENGFTATWNFNKANLPFGTVLKDFQMDPATFAFGVSLIQPSDGYAKTDRSIKYAILFIGLTFSLFFIIELLQKKPVHPVQYILIGLALIIFYTLLLSMSEFMSFDLSYLIAAGATVLLISSYAYGHFKKLQTALLFGGMLTVLYGFTFVLIRLEDTALLLGSIGLFIILAAVMYVSRKINWYGASPVSENIQAQSE